MKAVILAGPNGAGKSTLAARLVPSECLFLNADVIARERFPDGRPGASIAAGRLLLERLDQAAAEELDFALETNRANKTLAARIPRWQEAGYQVVLLFVWIPSAEMAVVRVAARVRSGGHDIPVATIHRRYRQGLRMFFEVYQPLVDQWKFYDNTNLARPIIVAYGGVRRRQIWNVVRQGADNERSE